MQRVKEDGDWCLMCPNESPGLANVWGDSFNKLYTKYETDGKYRKKFKARDLWVKILKAQIETGTPYLLYKDSCNAKSNQKNLGTIKSSNLCTEIVEYSSDSETAVCNLASIALPKFVENGSINYEKLRSVAYEVTENLNRVIDRNYYPTEASKTSNDRHRPIGIGVQGLADLFAMIKVDFDSSAALAINRKIFAYIYFGAVEASADLAKVDGCYETYEGSPASKGMLQFDLWEENPEEELRWDLLKRKIDKHGMRNSLLLAPMPTASTSQILGNNECFEPFTSCIYVRRVLSGEFVMVNKHLVKDLIEIDSWNEDIKDDIIRNNGSISQILKIPEEIRDRYKTVWEISMKSIIDMAAARGPYICQSQSMNLFMAEPTVGKVNSMHFYAWESGLKTGMYYLRSKPAGQAKKITVEEEKMSEQDQQAVVCSIENPDDCMMCGS
jgi:ribonucleoside-diphosphate reductase alpha chain